jgi:hypothetical protein
MFAYFIPALYDIFHKEIVSSRRTNYIRNHPFHYAYKYFIKPHPYIQNYKALKFKI